MRRVLVTTLAGGTGGARFLRGLRAELIDRGAAFEITVVGNTADDIELFGLHVSPDLDTVMYTLGGGVHEGQGWGRAQETFAAMAELAAYDAQPQWFSLGDRDLATHLVRTQMLAAGYPLSQVTQALCARWQPGARLLPMTDQRVQTHVVVQDEGGRRAVHFQEWWVRMHAATPALAIVPVGVEDAEPGPGVLAAIADADVVLLPPSNPVVSIGTILAVPGVREALLATAAPVVGVSPIIGGSPVRGMADACLAAIGVPTTAADVGRLYGGLIDGWLVDDADAGAAVEGVSVRSRDLYMRDESSTRAIAAAALDLAAELRGGG